MNREQAKAILLLYRPGLTDDGDPEVAEALALTKSDPELARWFEEYCARQNALRAKFQEINIPEGLKEQIVSEQKARERRMSWRRNLVVASVVLVGMIALAVFWRPTLPADDTFPIYRSRMARGALRGYPMDLATNSPVAVRAYLAREQAPADYVLPAPLQRAELVGCAVQSWQGAKVSMICFRTGKPLSPGQQSDMWLFVVERASVKEAPDTAIAQLAPVNRLTTAVWTQGDKLYLLGMEGDEQAVRRFL